MKTDREGQSQNLHVSLRGKTKKNISCIFKCFKSCPPQYRKSEGTEHPVQTGPRDVNKMFLWLGVAYPEIKSSYDQLDLTSFQLFQNLAWAVFFSRVNRQCSYVSYPMDMQWIDVLLLICDQQACCNGNGLHLYSAFIQSAVHCTIYASHSPIHTYIHTPTVIGCHARHQPAHQEQLRVRCLAQGHFHTPRVGSNRQPSNCQTTALPSWATSL